MSDHRGMIPGDSTMSRSVALAGALAELGQTRLRLWSMGATVDLHARVTNLPALLCEEVAARGQARLEAPALGAHFTITTDAGTWECGDAHAAAKLRERLHR